MISVVTGAGRGIGRAVAIELARRGSDVALLARTEAEIEETAARIAEIGRRAVALPCDVTNAEQIANAARRVESELGAPLVVVANAGVVRRATVAETSEAEWDLVVDTNLKGTFLTARAFVPAMLRTIRDRGAGPEKACGRFVAIGSISSTLGTARQSAYCAAKWGIVGFVKSLAEEVVGTGVQALVVLPGSVDTTMLRGSGYEPKMNAEDVARVVAYAALEAPAAMNGSAIEMFGA